MGSTTETSVHYVTDRRASQFTVQVFSGGLLSAFGHNPTIVISDFAGEAQVNPDDIERSSLRVTVKTESLTVKDNVADKDRREMERAMHEEILETASYPEIVYECTKIAATKTGEGQYSADTHWRLDPARRDSLANCSGTSRSD